MNERNQPLATNESDDGVTEDLNQNDQLLLTFLESNNAPCPVCGYDLRSLTKPVCPECAHRLYLTVGAQNVQLRWFLTAITPGIFSGIAAVLLSIPITVVIATGGQPPPLLIYFVDAFGYLSGISALIMMAMRKRIVAIERRKQQMFAGFVWGIHFFVFFLMLAIAYGWI